MAMNYTQLHRHHHADYAEAKEHIYRQIGKLDLELFDREVMVAVYVRPQLSAAGLTGNSKTQAEDVIQGKVCLLVAAGPNAFRCETEADATLIYGPSGPPKRGEWLMLRATEGTPVNICGPDATVVQVEDRHGELMKAYDWDSGWPCRIVSDTAFLARVTNPHSVV